MKKDIPKSVKIDINLLNQIKRIIKNNKTKYPTIKHFINQAVEEKLKKEVEK